MGIAFSSVPSLPFPERTRKAVRHGSMEVEGWGIRSGTLAPLWNVLSHPILPSSGSRSPFPWERAEWPHSAGCREGGALCGKLQGVRGTRGVLKRGHARTLCFSWWPQSLVEPGFFRGNCPEVWAPLPPPPGLCSLALASGCVDWGPGEGGVRLGRRHVTGTPGRSRF